VFFPSSSVQTFMDMVPLFRCLVKLTLGLQARRLWSGPVRLRAAAARRHSACSSRRNRDALQAAHTWAARQAPSASAGWGGRSRRGGGTARARPAVIATRCRRHTYGPGKRPTPAPAGEGGRGTLAAPGQ
jgi:hypothetical protein